ncbi:MAG: NIL domain-containing protein [Verrucomicrobiales bacterium]|nr:NIL domain-containing protein [Verrucomicrobiales bacterium]
MPKETQPKRPSPKTRSAGRATPARDERRRFWLTYPGKLITRPIIWQLSQKFAVVFNVRQASVTDELGIMCLELEGKRDEIKSAIRWLEKQGVKVEPVEINVIES